MADYPSISGKRHRCLAAITELLCTRLGTRVLARVADFRSIRLEIYDLYYPVAQL